MKTILSMLIVILLFSCSSCKKEVEKPVIPAPVDDTKITFTLMLMHRMDRLKPFNSFVSRKISLISYFTLSIGALSYIARHLVNNLRHHGFVPNNINQFWVDSEAFILMGAVIYIIATIFKKGVDIQNENDLTV